MSSVQDMRDEALRDIRAAHRDYTAKFADAQTAKKHRAMVIRVSRAGFQDLTVSELAAALGTTVDHMTRIIDSAD